MSLHQAKEVLAMAMDIKSVSKDHEHHEYTPREVISHELDCEFCCESPSASRLRTLLEVKDRLRIGHSGQAALEGDNGAFLWEEQFERAVHILDA